MATFILIRHGRSTANAGGVLAGRSPGVGLDETGQQQADRVGASLAQVPLAGVVTSPMQRCRETAEAVLSHQGKARQLAVAEDLTECDYGQWTGRKIADLATEDLWSVVQQHPSAAVFPGGESLAGMQARGVAAMRRLDAAIEAEHGSGAVWAAVTHGDLIKSVLADALGMHLDLFQRIHVHPASASIVRYGTTRPDVVAMNVSAADLSWLRGPAGDAQVGGEAGPPPAGHAENTGGAQSREDTSGSRTGAVPVQQAGAPRTAGGS